VQRGTPTPTGRHGGAPEHDRTTRREQHRAADLERLVAAERPSRDDGAARAEAADADGDAVRVRYEWHADGGRVSGGQDGSLLVPEQLRKGAVLIVSAIASDGRAESEPATANVRIGNREPAVTAVRFEPTDGIKPGETVIAVAEGADPDGDELDFHYEWRIGEAVQSGDRERFDTSKMKRGERLSVRVVASDGEDESTPVESQYLELGNSAPTIVSLPSAGMGADGVYHYGVEASDPDGDRNLRFRLAGRRAQGGPLLGEITGSRPTQAGVHRSGRGEYGRGSKRNKPEVTVRSRPAEPTSRPAPASPAP
jgi:hypothetical protein